MTTLTLSTTIPRSLDVDALIIGVESGTSGARPTGAAADVDAAFDGGLAATLDVMSVKGTLEEVTKIPTMRALQAPLVVAVGLGETPASGESHPLETLRRAAGAAARSLNGSERVGLVLPAATPEQAEAVALGALLGSYAFSQYQTGEEQRSPASEFTVHTAADSGGEAQWSAALHRAQVLADAVGQVRDLVNTAPCDLYPDSFAELTRDFAASAGLDVEVLDVPTLSEGGYGGILGVGQGSEQQPRLVRLAHRHPRATRTLALVGKGITFDSGGLSLKPTSGMDWMKSDMGGAGAVFGAIQAISRLELEVDVVAYLPLAENMPSGTAQRPSDVLQMYGGRTVEVLNTDAEGRLVLADAIVRAGEDEPDLLVDVATLTGAQLVALGTRTTGLMGSDDELAAAVADAAQRAGEATWPMPLPEELRKGLDSSVADIANVAGDRNAGMLVAGIFLREFVADGARWVHLDIAGPSFNQGEAHGYTPKGGTGAATRTLVQVAGEVAAGRL